MGEKHVQLPDGSVVAFPDTMADDAIGKILQQQMGQPQTTPDVEAIRQRNLQAGLAQAGTPFQRALQSADIQPDVQQMRSLNPFAAAAGGTQAALKIAGAPFTLLGAAMPNTVGPAMNAVGSLANKALEWNAARFGLSPEVRQSLLQKTGIAQNPQQAQAINEAGTAATGALGMAAIGGAVPALREGVGGGLQSAASTLAGKAFGAGENFMRTTELGKFAQEHGWTIGSKNSYLAAKQLTNTLNNEIQTKIIQPATEQGALIDGNAAIQKMSEYKNVLENRQVPDRAQIVAVDRMIKMAQDRLAKSDTPGFFTPDVAQDLKVQNNQILNDVYRKAAAGGNITEKGTAKMAALMEATDQLRTQLEQLHPELRNVNWHEGAALQLGNAMYDYLNKTARGEGTANVVGRAGLGKAATVSLYDVLKVRPIESRLAVLLGKTGRAISGTPPNIVTGVQNPFQGGSPGIPPPVTPSPPINPNSPLAEAPVSRGGSMSVRGSNNQTQIDNFYKQGKISDADAIKWGVSPELIRAKNPVTISRPEAINEHQRLIGILQRGNPTELRAELQRQATELKQYRAGR